MKETILALLIAKFSGVRKDGLARLAQALSLQAADETEAGALVEKLTPDKVNEFIVDYRKDVDKEVSDATKTHEGNLKKKYEFKEKAAEPGAPPAPTDPNDISAMVTAAVKAAVEPLAQELAGYKTGEISKTRLQTLTAKLEGVPESFKTQKLKDAERFIATMDDAAFTEYLGEVETGVTGLKQELADGGLAQQSRPIFGNPGKDGVSSGVAGYIASQTGENKPLAGKEV